MPPASAVCVKAPLEDIGRQLLIVSIHTYDWLQLSKGDALHPYKINPAADRELASSLLIVEWSCF